MGGKIFQGTRIQREKRRAAVTPLRKAVSSDPRQAIFANTSLAPLSWFHGSRVATAHAHQCCRFQSYAKTVPSRMKLTMKLTMRESASMTTDTWSRRVTSVFNSALELRTTYKIFKVPEEWRNTLTAILFVNLMNHFIECRCLAHLKMDSCIAIYTGWPNKIGTAYFPQYLAGSLLDAITGISVWG